MRDSAELATRLSRPLIPAELKDPMSGFFMLQRPKYSKRRCGGCPVSVSKSCWTSLPPRQSRCVFVSCPSGSVVATAGESKLDSQVLWDYGMLLLDKLIGRWVPVRFVSFMLVGGFGVLVHMSVLSGMLKLVGSSFVNAQIAATLVAMTANFVLNNVITYRDIRLKGWGWVRGLLSFMLACSVGAVANVGVAQYLFEQETIWFLAGLAGILVGAVWNYVITLVFTWRGASVR